VAQKRHYKLRIIIKSFELKPKGALTSFTTSYCYVVVRHS